MKRRAILELVCSLRKRRDEARIYMQRCMYTCNEMKSKEDACHKAQAYDMARSFREQHAGAYPYVTEYAGMAYAFHSSAHKCMELLNR
jgi:hypothetical protein